MTLMLASPFLQWKPVSLSSSFRSIWATVNKSVYLSVHVSIRQSVTHWCLFSWTHSINPSLRRYIYQTAILIPIEWKFWSAVSVDKLPVIKDNSRGKGFQNMNIALVMEWKRTILRCITPKFENSREFHVFQFICVTQASVRHKLFLRTRSHWWMYPKFSKFIFSNPQSIFRQLFNPLCCFSF